MPLYLPTSNSTAAACFYLDDQPVAREDLRQARVLIEKCGYLRRLPELEDAEKVILAASRHPASLPTFTNVDNVTALSSQALTA